MLDFLIPLSSVILAILTGIYVLLTHKLLRENRQANEQQSRILTLPHLCCNVNEKKDKLMLTIRNIGNVPACDIDILAVAVYFEENIDIPTFMADYVRTKYRNYALRTDKEGKYGVYDHMVYAFFPFKKKIVTELSFPVCPEQTLTLLQYRSVLGVNYSSVYWFYKSEEGIYKLGALDPNIITPSPRVNYDENSVLKTIDKCPIPKHIKESDFLNTWNHSIPPGYTITPFLGVEDRGEWHDI